jgi:hypothetical protein
MTTSTKTPPPQAVSNIHDVDTHVTHDVDTHVTHDVDTHVTHDVDTHVTHDVGTCLPSTSFGTCFPNTSFGTFIPNMSDDVRKYNNMYQNQKLWQALDK